MQATNVTSKSDFNALSRSKKVYKYFFVEMTFVILTVFFEPTFSRIVAGVWKRGQYSFNWTLSLDAHAVWAFLFLFLLLIQLFLGYQQSKKPSLKQNHKKLGYALFYVIIPIFLLIAIWVVIDRATPGKSIIYRKSPAIVLTQIIGFLIFLSWFVIRSFRALKQGDFLMHVDGIYGVFMLLSGFPFVRFLYALFWGVRGASPFSVVGMFFITTAIVIGHMLLGYYLSGRLRQNLTPLMVMVFSMILIAVLGANHYTFMDVP